MRKRVTVVKESLKCTQNGFEGKIVDFNERLTAAEKKNQICKESDVKVIQSAKPSWVIDIENKLVNLEDWSRKNILKIDYIEEHRKKTWENGWLNYMRS